MEICNFELAKKLKEKGFPIKTKTEGKFGLTEVKKVEILPTISQVLKWLRDKKKIHISIDLWEGTWGYDIIKIPSGESEYWTAYNKHIKKYDEAALDAIKYVLYNLI